MSTDSFSTQQLQHAQSMAQTGDLDSLRQRAFKNDKAALREAAQQFESIFMGMVLKSMRQANAVFEEDSPLKSRYGDMYRDMYDGQLSKDLSKQGSLGLAELLVEQFGGGGESYTPASVLRDGSNLDSARRAAKQNYDRQQANAAAEPTATAPALGKYYGAQRHQAFASA